MGCCCMLGGERRMCGVEFDERSTETEGEGELDMVAIGGGGDGTRLEYVR